MITFINYSRSSAGRLCTSAREATLYTYLFEKGMRIKKKENALKGQYILAQGNALGLRASREIVRATALIKENCLFRTKKLDQGFLKNMSCHSVRKEFFTLLIALPRTVYQLHPLPRATFRFVPPSILPWAELYWPFRPQKNSYYDLCIKSKLAKSGEESANWLTKGESKNKICRNTTSNSLLSN